MSLTAILAIKDWKWQWYLEEKQPSVETTELWLHTQCVTDLDGWFVIYTRILAHLLLRRQVLLQIFKINYHCLAEMKLGKKFCVFFYNQRL